MAKDPRLLNLLAALRAQLAPTQLVEVDHWPEDPEAMGVAAAGQPGLLAYIAIDGGSDDLFFLSMERPPGAEWSEEDALSADKTVGDVDELCEVLAHQFRRVQPAS